MWLSSHSTMRLPSSWVPAMRRGLAGHALLQVAVGGDDVDVVVERAGAGRGLGVEQAALAARRHRDADRGGEALAERAGRDLDAGRVPVLRVARGLRAPGAQRLQVLELQAEAGEVQLDVLRQAGVARGQDEPVAAQPVRVRRVVPHHVLEEQVRGGGEADRRPGVAVADLLDRVGGQDTHRVHRPQVEVGPADRLSQGSLRVHRTSFPPGQGSGCRVGRDLRTMIFDMTRHPRRMPGRWDVTPSRRSSDRANRPYSAPGQRTAGRDQHPAERPISHGAPGDRGARVAPRRRSQAVAWLRDTTPAGTRTEPQRVRLSSPLSVDDAGASAAPTAGSS